MLDEFARHLDGETVLKSVTEGRLLQGPLADAMTHMGQLAMLRRLTGSPIPPEYFIEAAIDPANLGPQQPEPVAEVYEALMSATPGCGLLLAGSMGPSSGSSQSGRTVFSRERRLECRKEGAWRNPRRSRPTSR